MELTTSHHLLISMVLILIARMIEAAIAGRASSWQWHLIGLQAITVMASGLLKVSGTYQLPELGLTTAGGTLLNGLAVASSVLMIATWHIGSQPRKDPC